jgi:hypothetical protein
MHALFDVASDVSKTDIFETCAWRLQLLAGQVVQTALVGSVDTGRALLTAGTGRGRGPPRNDDGDPVGRWHDPLDREVGRDHG